MSNPFIHFLENLKNFIWGPPLLFLLIGVGAYLTWVIKGIQFRYLFFALKQVFKAQATDSQGDINHFQALMTSLAGAIGTGTIVGVATSVAIGGLGAIFWMWVSALLGMATKYAESLLAVKYRQYDANGEMTGGPMQYIEQGLGWKKLAVFFAMTGSLAALTTGNLVQVNAIKDAINTLKPIDPLWIGMGLAVLTSAIILGGVKSIGRVAGILVPVMALFYLGSGLMILVLHFNELDSAFQLIFQSAFTGQAAFGGFAGSSLMMAMQMGISRGVFSNEAGLGISSIAAAAAKTDSPGRQAMINMTGALISTLIICTMTGLVVAVTQMLGAQGADGQTLNGVALAVAAFSDLPAGSYIVSIGLILFAFSTVIAWAYYGEKCFEYLFGARYIRLYRLLFAGIALPGALLEMEVVWHFADITNGLMIIPNLIALVALSKVIVSETELFLTIVKAELEPEISYIQDL